MNFSTWIAAGLMIVIGAVWAIVFNADLLLDPIRDLLTRWLPYPPRVEVSSLGDAAVLTGILLPSGLLLCR